MVQFMSFRVIILIIHCGLQNMRGGKVKLQSILMPLSEFDHEEKGDALHGGFSCSTLKLDL